MHVSQVTVAEKLKVRQPTISKIERREDMNLSTLRRYVRPEGGDAGHGSIPGDRNGTEAAQTRASQPIVDPS